MSILKKACSFCIYQERTQEEVREKMKSWGVDKEEIEEVIVWLITENFINEGRFAKQFAGGKFRVKKWGKKKIIFELKSKGLSERCIADAIKEIEDEDYFETLNQLALQKKESLPQVEFIAIKKKKVISYLLAKGYDYEDIFEVIKDWRN